MSLEGLAVNLYLINLFKIADYLGFENARRLLSNLPDDVSQNMTREKWDIFFAKDGKEQEEQFQYSLFEKASNRQHPTFTQSI